MASLPKQRLFGAALFSAYFCRIRTVGMTKSIDIISHPFNLDSVFNPYNNITMNYTYLYYVPINYSFQNYQPLPTLSPHPNNNYAYPFPPFAEPVIFAEDKESNTLSHVPSDLKEEELVPPAKAPKVSRFKYAKKNVESNVVNQIFSYLNTKCKSGKVLLQILGSEEKVDAFYQLLKQGKKRSAKYMGRAVLQALIDLEEDHPVYILHRKLKSRISLKIGEIRRGVRLLTSHFLRCHIIPTLLTSSKLDKTTIRHHLTRAREIQAFITAAPNSHQP